MIYFLQIAPDGPIKIGFTTNDVRRRVTMLQTGCPWRFNILGVIEGNIAKEKQIHLVLARWRAKGEWFDPHPIVLGAIAEALRVGQPAPANSGDGDSVADRHPLTAYRIERDMTLRDLQKVTGVSATMLSRYENGILKPNERAVIKICKATRIPGGHLRPDWIPIFAKGASQ